MIRPDPNATTTLPARVLLNIVARLTGRTWFWYWDAATSRYRLFFGRADR